MSKINRYHAQLFSQYLAKLRATPDGDGSLLDHMTILYGSGISNSTRHSGDNLPLLLVGGGAGRLKGGRHLKYSGKPTMANLLVTLMDKMDVPVEQSGRQHRQTSARYALRSVVDEAMRHDRADLPRWSRQLLMGAAAIRLPLIDAAKNGDQDALRALLQKKADVNAAEADGSTALHWASYQDDLESADLLIRAGAKVNAANDLGVTPLWAASQNGSAAMVRRLLEAGANPNAGAAGRARRR